MNFNQEPQQIQMNFNKNLNQELQQIKMNKNKNFIQFRPTNQ